MTELRPLSKTEISSLGRLFESEKEAAVDIWQERVDFLGIYRPFLHGEPEYWGVLIDGEVAGVTGMLPARMRAPWKTSTTEGFAHLDTDLFVAPEFRRTLTLRSLLMCRPQTQCEDPAKKNWYYFGIEQIPEGQDICTRIAPRFDISFTFPFTTRLEQIFLTEEPFDFIHDGIIIQRLIDAAPALLRDWEARLTAEAKDTFLLPVVENATWKKLLELDPEARLVYHRDGTAGWLVFTQSSARRFRQTGRSNLTLARLARARPGEIGPGLELKLAIGALGFGEATPAFHDCLRATLRWCWEQGFHCLSARDLPSFADENDLGNDLGNDLRKEMGNDVARFERRVFLSYSNNAPFASDLRAVLVDRSPRGKLDSAFL